MSPGIENYHDGLELGLGEILELDLLDGDCFSRSPIERPVYRPEGAFA